MEWNVLSRARPNQRTTNQSFILLGENLKRTCGSKSSFIGGEFCPQTIYKNCKKIKIKIPSPKTKPPKRKARKQTQKKATSYKSAKLLLPQAWSVTRIQDRFGGGGGVELGTNTHRLCKALIIISLDLRFFGLVILRQGSLWV